MPSYPVVLEHLLVSPGHRYGGRPADGAADVPTHDLARAQVVAGTGIVGDRFFGRAAHADAAVTLIAAEAIEAVADELDLLDEHGGRRVVDPLVTRRNVVVRGVPLDPLRDNDFELVAADGSRVTPLRTSTRCAVRVDGPGDRPRRPRGDARAGWAAVRAAHRR